MSQRLRMTRGATANGKLRLPEDVLDAVLSFGDLRSLAAAATSVEFRDGFARCAPGLARRLVMQYHPILKSIDSGARTARELFLSQTRLFGPRPHFPQLAPKAGLDAYTFSLEIEDGDHHFPYPPDEYWSLYVGTANPVAADGSISFTIPPHVFDKAWTSLDEDFRNILLRLMVSRRGPRGPEFARLGSGLVDEVEPDNADGAREIHFFSLCCDEMRLRDEPLNYVEVKRVEKEIYFEPNLDAIWTEAYPNSILQLNLQWFVQHSYSDQHASTIEDLCLLLEHYATWT